MGEQKKAASKPYKVRISNHALRNIDEITGYIAFINQQPLNAIRVGDAIFATVEKIAINPYAYRECEEIVTKTKMYRRAICMSWTIIFRVQHDEILILGIIHSARRPARIKALRKIK